MASLAFKTEEHPACGLGIRDFFTIYPLEAYIAYIVYTAFTINKQRATAT
jgi:hypothetical protein